jgi:hypothetical protein
VCRALQAAVLQIGPERLGRGGQGTVFKGTAEIAIKRVSMHGMLLECLA